MKVIKGLVAILAALVLTACGSGGCDAGSSPLTGSTGCGGGGGTIQAADLSVVLSTTSVDNSGSQTVDVTVTAVDASRVGLSGIAASLSVNNGAVIVVDSAETDSSGNITATVSIGADHSNRVITVTAVSGSVTKVAAFQVTGANLQATLLPTIIAPGASGQVQYRLIDVNSNPMIGQAISVSGAGITAANGETGTNGEYTYTYTAPAASGNLDVTAVAGGVTLVKTVLVQGGTVPVVPAGSVLSASVSANPSVIPVNSATSNNRAEIRALFLGSANAPIPNVRVRFDLDGDANSIGGTLAAGTNLVYSNESGVAITAYIPGTRFSPTDGLTVRACWDYDDFAAGTCPNATRVTMTVTSEALSVTIGTDNTIAEGANKLTYIKRFAILVVDSAGHAKGNVQITPSVDLVTYMKGYYDGAGNWNRKAVAVPGVNGLLAAVCANEDLNRNGVLEDSEDVNHNGKIDPRKSDVAVSMVDGVATTDSNGLAFLQIEYPKNVATWLNYDILVAASGIAGTEGRTTWSGTLGAAAAEFTAPIAPSFVQSPYGISASCTNPN